MIKFKIEHKLSLQERQDLIIEQAISRGLVAGARFRSPQNGHTYKIYKIDDIYRFVYDADTQVLNLLASVAEAYGEYIYYNEKWAELSDIRPSWETVPDKHFFDPYRNQYKT